MREIKFRTWHKARIDAFEVKMRKDCMIYFDLDDYADDHDGEYGSGNIDLENMPIMQYTGLKDKNGLTDIYEGDIITHHYHHMNGVIEWKNSALVLMYDDKKYDELRQIDMRYFEIIGNIYENPELLSKDPL